METRNLLSSCRPRPVFRKRPSRRRPSAGWKQSGEALQGPFATSVLPVGLASPSPLAILAIYCTKGQVALAHWSHSAWYDPLAPPFPAFRTAVLGHICENILTFVARHCRSAEPLCRPKLPVLNFPIQRPLLQD